MGRKFSSHVFMQAELWTGAQLNYTDQMIRRCVAEEEIPKILYHRHSAPVGDISEELVLQPSIASRILWPTLFKDAYAYYILVAVDYVSKWVEAEAYPTNDAEGCDEVFAETLFTRFGTPRAIISDEGPTFMNKWLKWLLDSTGVKHKVATAYHPADEWTS
ncbi:uncharacterized protein [Gossypium hirsutum]|uniref:Integrase catalytic domain-containing protein n=1 Tax=Gossypium hirsutum TaxID=3635 RepID=A0ABM2YNH1_GOSHI|nr:uncharacterized protein LOC121205988 [Gossypium hirsutum]